MLDSARPGAEEILKRQEPARKQQLYYNNAEGKRIIAKITKNLRLWHEGGFDLI